MGKKKRPVSKTQYEGGDGDLQCESAEVENGNSGINQELVTPNHQPKYQVDDLLSKVDQLTENFDYPLALKFCEKALKMEPNNINAIEVMGNICSEIGDSEKAKLYYMKAVELQPDDGYIKYLCLGQLSEGREAVAYYQKSIDLMTSTLNRESDDLDASLAKRDISNAFCSLAEIFMTDCCMEDDAEKSCENACQKAVEVDASNPEAYIAMSNFLLSKEDLESAKCTASKLVEMWKSLSEGGDEAIVESFPYESRMTLMKILIEVEQYEEVARIGSQLVEENEDDVRLWYFMGLSNSLSADGEDAQSYLEKALELYDENGHNDEDMFNHIKELLSSCPTINEEEDFVEDDSNDNHVNGMDVDS